MMNSMNLALVVGFVAVSGSGALLWYRGRLTSAAVLGGVLAVSVVIFALTSGRDAVSQVILGGLIGLPVLLASVLATDRRERRHTSATKAGDASENR